MLKKIVIGVAILFLALQAVPYGRDHSNPPVTGEPNWNSPETRATFERACADCHSHATRWPWYSHVAPVSWLIQKDVDHGRSEFNVSTYGADPEVGKDAAEEVEKGKMPLPKYLRLHPEAKLTDEERVAFARGLDATFRAGAPKPGSDVGEKSGYYE